MTDFRTWDRTVLERFAAEASDRLREQRAQMADAQVRLMLSARAGADVRPYCIDARGEKGDCGPDAWLYEPK